MTNLYTSVRKPFLLYGFFVSLFLSAFYFVNAQPMSQTFNSSGTYTVPAGYTAIVTIQAWGGGAGGGSATGKSGGGGGGAYASISTTLAPGTYTVTVGTAGTVGINGGSSIFVNLLGADLLIAGGGLSTATATGGGGGTVIIGTGFAGGAGGDAGNGTNAGGGGGSGSATSSAVGGTGGAGSAGNGAAGGTGGIGQGNGGNGGNQSGTPDATVGIAPGGGGGGKGSGGGTSQAGAAGRVIITVSSVLPVSLGNIKAFEKQAGIQIDWTAYTEVNVSKYEIERSANAVSFTTIGEIAARNLSTETTYSFFDAKPFPGVSYYRLKNIDIDGKAVYSSILKINLDKSTKGFTIYPNPVTSGYIALQSADLAKGKYQIKIFSATGQEVFSQRFSHNGGSINQTLQLPASTRGGTYTLQLNSDDAKIITKAFIVR